MEGRAGRLVNSTTNRLSNVTHRLADGLTNIVEGAYTKDFSTREGLQIFFGVATIIFGISAALGIINQEIDLVEAALITTTAASATITAKINKHNPPHIDNKPPKQ